MIDFPWGQEIVKDVVDLADCIELVVAFSDDDDAGRFTHADFILAVQSEILSEEEDDFLSGEQIDDLNANFEEAMALIKNRALWLGETYPFRQDDGEVLFAPQTSKKHYLSYLFLLACSCHNRIPSFRPALRVEFENLCKEAMRALFPAWAEVFLFSQNSEDRKNLGWSARKAISALAEKLNAQVYQEEIDKLPDTQRECGIDLIAICSFDDELEYPFFAFAQCTVAKEWWTKKHEAKKRDALSAFVRLDTDHTNFLLIPHFPRISLTEWREDRSHTIDCILCDRYRICRLLEKSKPLTCQALPCGMRQIFQEIQKHLPEHH